MLSHSIVYETARTDLLDLEKRELLKSIKVGRKLYFSPVQKIEEKLADS